MGMRLLSHGHIDYLTPSLLIVAIQLVMMRKGAAVDLLLERDLRDHVRLSLGSYIERLL